MKNLSLLLLITFTLLSCDDYNTIAYQKIKMIFPNGNVYHNYGGKKIDGLIMTLKLINGGTHLNGELL